MTRALAAVACLAALAGVAQSAHAQERAALAPGTAPGAPPGPSLAPVPPEVVAPDQSRGRDADQTLSSRLAQSNGTLRPPAAVDPGMQRAPTERGTTPVIPPPGTPGGAPGAVAK